MYRWAGAIDGIIQGGVSAEDFAHAAGVDPRTARDMLAELIREGIGREEDGTIYFSDGDRLRAGVLALQKGSDIDEVAPRIGWRDFEGLAAEILESKGFATMRNFMLKGPRMEIDVVGIRLGVAVLIDCKHWKRVPDSTLRGIVRRQAERARRYISSTDGSMGVPVVVTLHQDAAGIVDSVPVVPIARFASFVDELYGNLDSMGTVRA